MPGGRSRSPLMRAPIRPIAGLALLSLTFGPSAALAQPGIGAVGAQAGGLEAAKGILSAQYLKDVTDPQGKNEPGFKGWAEFMGKYHPGGSIEDAFNAYG